MSKPVTSNARWLKTVNRGKLIGNLPHFCSTIKCQMPEYYTKMKKIDFT